MTRKIVHSWILSAALLACGCSVYDASLLLNGSMQDGSMQDGSMQDGSMQDGSMQDGSMQDGSMQDGSVPDGSMQDGSVPGDSLIPPRPDSSFEGESIEALTFAIRRPVFDQTMNDQWKQIGLNVDGFDTQDGNLDDVECLPVGGGIASDGENGIDNVFGSTLIPLVTVSPALANVHQDLRDAQEIGNATLILHMTGYNGNRDDPQVRAFISQSVAGTSMSLSNVSFVDGLLIETSSGNLATLPGWDGTDHWYVRDDGFAASMFANPQILDDNAYVSGGKLVFRLPERSQFLFLTDEIGIVIKLTQATIIVEIKEDLSGLGPLNLGGRMSVNDFLDTADSAGVCVGTPLQMTFDISLRRMADVLAAPGGAGGPSSLCDSISMGVLFEEGVRAQGVPIVVPSPYYIPNPCAFLQ